MKNNVEAKKMLEMRLNGATFQEIGDAFGITRQGALSTVNNYCKLLAGIRGHGFDVNQIKYQGIYEYFLKNPSESASSFVFKVFGYNSGKSNAMKHFLLGERTMYFSIEQVKRICEIVGKPFEEVFKEREVDG